MLYRWRNCTKNPGHEDFYSTQSFEENCMTGVQNANRRDRLRAVIGLTVRLRIYWTSPRRQDDDPMSSFRGTRIHRMGTGFVHVSLPVSEEPCPCVECNKEITRKVWRFYIRTAHSFVYNTEEARSTKVDLFYDDDSCRLDGRMTSVTGLNVAAIYPDRDICDMMCVTHDEDLGERIKSAWTCWSNELDEQQDLSGINLLTAYDGGRDPVLIVSHPHGGPKKITLGEGRDVESHRVEYNAATCQGCSGAPVFRYYPGRDGWRLDGWFPAVHSMSSTQLGQLNFGSTS